MEPANDGRKAVDGLHILRGNGVQDGIQDLLVEFLARFCPADFEGVAVLPFAKVKTGFEVCHDVLTEEAGKVLMQEGADVKRIFGLTFARCLGDRVHLAISETGFLDHILHDQ